MSQIQFHQKAFIQEKAIELLQSGNVHLLAMFCFAKPDKAIEPLLLVADDMPSQTDFITEFYALCDKYTNFAKVREESLNE